MWVNALPKSHKHFGCGGGGGKVLEMDLREMWFYYETQWNVNKSKEK